jgi:carboxylesterase type B
MESTRGIPAISPTSSTANTAWDNFMDVLPQCVNISLNDVECIRNLTTSELIVAFNDAQIFFDTEAVAHIWTPTLDRDIIPAFPSTLRPTPGVVKAVMIGTNKDEGAIFRAFFNELVFNSN